MSPPTTYNQKTEQNLLNIFRCQTTCSPGLWSCEKANEVSPEVTALCAGVQGSKQGRTGPLSRGEKRGEFTEPETAGQMGQGTKGRGQLHRVGGLQKSTGSLAFLAGHLAEHTVSETAGGQARSNYRVRLGVRVPGSRNEETSLNTQNIQQKGHTFGTGLTDPEHSLL